MIREEPLGPRAPYSPETFRADAGVLDGVSLLGDGTVSDMVWSRPAVTILGIDCPPTEALFLRRYTTARS